MLSFTMVTAKSLIKCLLVQMPQCCQNYVAAKSILLDTDDSSLIAYMGDVHDKEEPTIKNMSGNSYIMLQLR